MARICLSVPKVDAGPQAFTVFPTDESHANSWVFDSGASTHMTNDPGKLCSLSPYYGLTRFVLEMVPRYQLNYLGLLLSRLVLVILF